MIGKPYAGEPHVAERHLPTLPPADGRYAVPAEDVLSRMELGKSNPDLSLFKTF